MLPLTERRKRLFWSHVEKRGDDECWPWTACVTWNGYGLFGVDVGGKLRNRNAHRVSWVATHGPIAGGLHVLHRCDNRRCCNPAHLFLGTARDNAHDMIAKGRALPQAGDHNHGRKLCFAEVQDIRQQYATGRATQQQLAALFKVSAPNVSMIVNRRSWNY